MFAVVIRVNKKLTRSSINKQDAMAKLQRHKQSTNPTQAGYLLINYKTKALLHRVLRNSFEFFENAMQSINKSYECSYISTASND